MKQYGQRDIMQLDVDGNYYARHVQAMTEEGLFSKSDIAGELAWRDMVIDDLKEEINTLRKDAQPSEQPRETCRWKRILVDSFEEPHNGFVRHKSERLTDCPTCGLKIEVVE